MKSTNICTPKGGKLENGCRLLVGRKVVVVEGVMGCGGGEVGGSVIIK